MINGPRRLHESVNRVQSTLAVSIVIYKKYLPIFRSVFRIYKPETDKKTAITTAKLFEYIWIIFVTLKSRCPSADLTSINYTVNRSFPELLPPGLEDLLNSYHILLCIIDLITEELRVADFNILNPEFSKCINLLASLIPRLVSLMDNSGMKTSLDFLSRQFDGVELDAKHMLFHWVVPKLREYQAKKIIRGKDDQISLLLHWSTNL